jgi:DNA polymerase-3 subunit delta
LLESSLKKIKKLFGEALKGINFVYIDDTNVDNIISDLETPSFGFDKKLIIAKNTGLFKKETKKKTKKDDSSIKAKLTTYLEENFEYIKDGIVLVFVEDEIDKSDLVQFINKNGIVCNFEYQKANQIQARIKQITNSYKVNIDAPTMSYFIECCGTDMQDLINEIRKLIEYEGPGGTITKEDIDNLSIKKIESVIFDLTDSLGKKNTKVAIEVLRNLILSKEPIQKILITLYNHFKKLYLVKMALKENKDIIYALDLKPNQTFLVNKYKMQAGYFKTAEIRKILKELCDLDYKYKIGEIDLEVGFESILCAYC